MSKQIEFYKYQGTGNDFIMLDNTSGKWNDLTISQIQKLTNRKFGIGADGLIKINLKHGFDFEVDYYNADGTKSFCGNGARCSVMFANKLGLIKDNKTHFWAIDGEHAAVIFENNVRLKMNDVSEVTKFTDTLYEANTGSPHYLSYFSDLESQDVVAYGKSIRYNDMYKENGINVNLIEELNANKIKVFTYERGVEDETLSCGTGVTAAALSYALKNKLTGSILVDVETKGGNLAVQFDKSENYTDIWLIGPAEFVFSGKIELS